MKSASSHYDAIIVGGGPAGLSAALLLGRCRRDVVVIDEGRPRNESSPAMHGFLSRDGIPPADFLQICRDELAAYPSVTITSGVVREVERNKDGFLIELQNGDVISADCALIATGLIDQWPEIDGLKEYYGTSVHLCPYCDGWENRDRRIVVLGADSAAVALAMELLIWSDDISLFTNGEPFEDRAVVSRLEKLGIKQVTGRIVRVSGSRERIEMLHLEDGSSHPRDAVFFVSVQAQHSEIARKLGCSFPATECGVKTEENGSTGKEGLFAAGNASEGIQMAIIAAAEGLKAAAAMNNWLLEREQDRLLLNHH